MPHNYKAAHVRFDPVPEVHKIHKDQAPRPQQPKVPDFRFCVELGLVVRSRTYKHASSAGVEEEISARLAKSGIANHVTGTKAESQTEWTVAKDLAIPSHPRDHKFGVKLVSPFWRFSRHDTWMLHLRGVLQTLHHSFEVTATHQCSTSIHVVPACGFWRLSQAKALAKSAVYFERCFDALVPPYRRRSVWAKSNRHNAHMGRLSTTECFESIVAQKSFAQLGACMNWCAADSATGAALGRTADFAHSGFRWNLASLMSEGDGFGSVEFRQPGASTAASDAIAWVMMVVCFARLSCTYGDSLKPRDPARLASLGEWLLYEADCSGVPHKALLRNMFDVAQPVKGREAGLDAGAITFDEDQRLRFKEKERNIALEKYRKLVKHL
ncbi:hypothetical protein B0T26DRAFT_737254 [Lasiosphaeria miniovina]|uniref:Uncharacterized protein n=1 Tax=Lasiosphaeria miniovina TaxID=1954250 RepID=A0AA40BI88_9PEZI|nr:uncharacterized protein B0T26DRAFT_737254 [Lasiosphaeria miniovina]KAK0734680.1 hypothetical protein B0T26DRAFT_737254 [Lasiosphaeria miniovina]